jgi:hypothetical protein
MLFEVFWLIVFVFLAFICLHVLYKSIKGMQRTIQFCRIVGMWDSVIQDVLFAVTTVGLLLMFCFGIHDSITALMEAYR